MIIHIVTLYINTIFIIFNFVISEHDILFYYTEEIKSKKIIEKSRPRGTNMELVAEKDSELLLF